MSVPDVSPVTIIQQPLVPVVVQIPTAAAPKRPSPTPQEPNEDIRPPPRCLKLATAAPPFDPKEKGLLILQDPNDPGPFPSTIKVCSGFVYKGQACSMAKGSCDKNTFLGPVLHIYPCLRKLGTTFWLLERLGFISIIFGDLNSLKNTRSFLETRMLLLVGKNDPLFLDLLDLWHQI